MKVRELAFNCMISNGAKQLNETEIDSNGDLRT